MGSYKPPEDRDSDAKETLIFIGLFAFVIIGLFQVAKWILEFIHFIFN